MSISTATAFALQFPAECERVCDYADSLGAHVHAASTAENDEHIAVVMHDDHVFAAASSKLSQVDALVNLSKRIRDKVWG